MVDDMASRLRTVKARPLVIDLRDGDPEASGGDHLLTRWHEDLKIDWAAFELEDGDVARMINARPGEQIVRWSDEDQDWMVKPFELPRPGLTYSEEEERAVYEEYDELVEIVLDSGADCHLLPLS